MINRTCFPFGVDTLKGPLKLTTTTNGTYQTSEIVIIQNLKFPEFGNRSIGDVKADVFYSPNCKYDIILGRTELRKMGVMFNFADDTVTWLGRTISMKTTNSHAVVPDSLLHQIEKHLGMMALR